MLPFFAVDGGVKPFLSKSPVRGICSGLCSQSAQEVSIQSPVRGTLSTCQALLDIYLFLSAPVRDILRWGEDGRGIEFLSSPPCGGHFPHTLVVFFRPVSIQSPVRGTFLNAEVVDIINKFLSSPPCGGH